MDNPKIMRQIGLAPSFNLHNMFGLPYFALYIRYVLENHLYVNFKFWDIF